MTRLDRQRGPPGARRLRLAHHVENPKLEKGKTHHVYQDNEI